MKGNMDREINKCLVEIISRDKARNRWTVEQLARKLGYTPERVKAIESSPATVMALDLSRFVKHGLDARSFTEFAKACTEK